MSVTKTLRKLIVSWHLIRTRISKMNKARHFWVRELELHNFLIKTLITIKVIWVLLGIVRREEGTTSSLTIHNPWIWIKSLFVHQDLCRIHSIHNSNRGNKWVLNSSKHKSTLLQHKINTRTSKLKNSHFHKVANNSSNRRDLQKKS